MPSIALVLFQPHQWDKSFLELLWLVLLCPSKKKVKENESKIEFGKKKTIRYIISNLKSIIIQIKKNLTFNI